MKLRFRVQGQSAPLELDFEPETCVGMLPFLLQEPLDTNGDFIAILCGVPPKPLPDDVHPDTPISKVFREGEMLVASKRAGGGEAIKRGVTDGKYVPPTERHATFVIRKVPSDNSCCFHSCAYVLMDKSRSNGAELRRRCCEAVALHPQKFTADFLEMSNERYVTWLSHPDTWGGATELGILSFLFQTVIHALDLQSNHQLSFGKDEGYSTEAYVVYTGKHYDAMAMSPSVGGVSTGNAGSESDDQVLFNPRDDKVKRAAADFIAAARSKFAK